LSKNGEILIYGEKSTRFIKEILLSRVTIYKASDIEKGTEYLQKNPLGTGAYYLSFQDSTQAIYKKNKYHRDFQNNKKAPDIVRTYKEKSIDKQVEQLLNGEADFVSGQALYMYEQIFNYPNLRVNSTSSNQIMYLYLDSVSQKPQGLWSNDGQPLRKNPLRDKRVRYAIVHALDMQTFIQDKFFGKANLLVIPALPNQKGYPTYKKYYKYDVELSKSLLKEAGYANGFAMQITIDDMKISAMLADFIKESLKEINIEVSIDVHDGYLFEITGSSAVLYGIFSMRGSDTYGLLAGMFYNAPDWTGTLNIFNYHYPKVNSLIENLATMSEFDTRIPDLYTELTDFVYDELAIIPLINPHFVYVTSEKYTLEYIEYYTFSDFKVVD
jgi:ABC-type transport system substrate-binding protein